jgi:hypothetical protein
MKKPFPSKPRTQNPAQRTTYEVAPARLNFKTQSAASQP